MARSKCGNFYLKNPNISWILEDETYFTLSYSTVSGNNKVYTSDIAASSANLKYTLVKKFDLKLLMSLTGASGFPSFRKMAWLSLKESLQSVLNMESYLLSISITQKAIISSGHYANDVVNYFRAQKIKFVENLENPANVPEVRVIEDGSILKCKVYENGWVAKDSDKLKNRISLC